jgi:hypothetical protein
MDAVTVEMWEGLRAFHIYTVRRRVLSKGKKFNLLTPEGVNFICEKGVKSVDNLHPEEEAGLGLAFCKPSPTHGQPAPV